MKKITGEKAGMYGVLFEAGRDSSVKVCIEKIYQLTQKEKNDLAGLLIREESREKIIPIFGIMPKETALKYALDTYNYTPPKGKAEEQHKVEEKYKPILEVPASGMYDVLYEVTEYGGYYDLDVKFIKKKISNITGLAGIRFRGRTITLFGSDYMSLERSVIYALEVIEEIRAQTEPPRVGGLDILPGKGIYDFMLKPSAGSHLDECIIEAWLLIPKNMVAGLDFNGIIVTIFGCMNSKTAIKYAKDDFYWKLEQRRAKARATAPYLVETARRGIFDRCFEHFEKEGFKNLRNSLAKVFEKMREHEEVVALEYNGVQLPVFGSRIMSRKSAVKYAIDTYLSRVGAQGVSIDFDDYEFFRRAKKATRTSKYHKGIVRFANRWACVMTHLMEKGEEITEELERKAEKLADIEGVSGNMFYTARGLVIRCWAHGEKIA